MVEIPSKIYLRYYRPVKAHPDGAIVHHGDCEYYRVKICTCGLLHDLRVHGDGQKIYPFFDEQVAEQDKAVEKIIQK